MENCWSRPRRCSHSAYPFLFILSSSSYSAHSTTYSYLGDEEATRAAFTEDGFYRTGDLVRRVGDDYCIDGRVSSDCKQTSAPNHRTSPGLLVLTSLSSYAVVKFRGYKVPTLEVEMHLLTFRSSPTAASSQRHPRTTVGKSRPWCGSRLVVYAVQILVIQQAPCHNQTSRA